MKKEFLFRALGEVGDDLIHMAEHRKFSSQWKKWVSLAACFVLIISLSALVLPYFPMGCGSSMKEEAAPAATEDTPVAEEEKAEAPAEEAPAAEEEAPAEDAKMEPQEEKATEETVPDTEAGVTDGVQDNLGVTQLTVCSTIYYLPDVLLEDAYIDGKPGSLGEYIGDVTDSDDESLIGCAVYAVQHTTWFSNHAVDGQSVPQNIYVEGPDRWLFGTTGNEKTVSRYTAADVQNAIDTGETQWIIDSFVKPVEAHVVDLLEGGKVADSETLNGLFLASLQLNTGTMVDWVWWDNGGITVHPKDVEQRLYRFLDEFTYDPTVTEAYDPVTGLLHFSEKQVYQQANGLYLKRASVEGDRVWLWVGLPETDDLYDEKMYELRFDDDSWRYINIATPG